jgi:hypothetical protein
MLRLITALIVAVFALSTLTSPVYAQATKEPAKEEGCRRVQEGSPGPQHRLRG